MKKIIKIVFIALICFIIVLPNFALAANNSNSNEIKTEDFIDIYNTTGTTKNAMPLGGTIIRVIQVIAVIVAIGALIVIGIKYMTTSANEKAEVKQQLIAYAIGAVLIFAGTGILQLIATFVLNIKQ